MKKVLMLTCLAAMLAACHDEDEKETPEVPLEDRTVVVYMVAENSLSYAVNPNLEMMKEGSLQLTNGNLLVYVDSSDDTELPWFARIKNGEVIDSVSITDMGISNRDEYASDPRVFEDVLRYAVDHYPARRDYALLLWGHCSGWLVEDSIPVTRAYGVDNGVNGTKDEGYWLNFPTMARIFEKLPVHWSYIFSDCCNFMCLETMYELRNTCDYLVGSPAEIPGYGAPYKDIVTDMFLPDAEAACRAIVDKYYTAQRGELPLSIVKTSEMQSLADATRTAWQTVKNTLGSESPDMQGIIHYAYNGLGSSFTFNPCYSICYDAGDFFLRYLPEADYRVWRQAFDRAVIDKRIATRWLTFRSWYFFFTDFEVTEEKFHGVSMFVPQTFSEGEYHQYNEDIKKMAWYDAVLK